MTEKRGATERPYRYYSYFKKSLYRVVYFPLMMSFAICQVQAFPEPSTALISEEVPQEQSFDSLLAGNDYRKGLDLYETNQYDQAIPYFKKAAKGYEGMEMWPEYVEAVTLLGLNFAYMDKFDSSEVYLNRARKVGLQYLEKNSVVLSDLYIALGGVFGTVGRYGEALGFYHEALESREMIYGKDHPETGLILHYMGIIYGVERNFIKAKELQERALILLEQAYGSEHRLVADTYDELGSMWRFLGDLNKGIEYHEKALEVRLLVLGPEHLDMAYGYHHLGGLWFEKKEFTKALSYYEKGLGISLKHNGERHSVTASFYQIMGDAHQEQGDFKKSQEYLEKALKVRGTIFGGQHPETAKSFQALADLWFDKGDFEKSIANYVKAVNIRKSVYGTDHPIVASGYYNMGLALEAKGAKGKAEEYFKRALAIALQTEEPESTSLYQSALGNLYMDRGDWRRALGHYQESLSAASSEFNPEDLLSNPALEDIIFPYQALSTLRSKGLALKNAYAEKKETVTGNDFLKEALKSTYLAVELMDKIQAGYQEVASQQLFSREHAGTYVNGINMAQALFESTGEHRFLSVAFEIAERSKAFRLSQNIKKQNSFALPDSLLVQERTLKMEVSFQEKEIFNMASQQDVYNEEQVEELKDKLFQSKRNLELLTKRFEEEYPAYYELKYEKNLIGVAQLQKALPENTGLIEYVWTDSLLYAFTISPGYQGLKVLPVSEELRGEIEQFITFNGDYQNALSKGSSAMQLRQYAALSFKIFNQLLSSQLDSLGQEVKSLIIVPDGPLARLPFATLTVRKQNFDNSTDNVKYKALDYLIKSASVRYAFSASLLFGPDHRPGPDRKVRGNFIGFAPRYLGKGRESDNTALRKAYADDEGILSPLRFNQTEVKNIAQIIGGAVFLGEEATEMAFKENATAYNIVHIAAHGLVNDSLPDYSGIAFSEIAPEDTVNDGFLQSYELYNMKLQAELVVLSACETAVGQWQNGEGLISIARAFRYAGSQNILASQWTIDDENTAALMQLFYVKLKSGLQKDVALRQAQLEFLESSIYSHPAFWGAYALWGDSEPIQWEKSSDKNSIVYLSLILLATGITISFASKRKKKESHQLL